MTLMKMILDKIFEYYAIGDVLSIEDFLDKLDKEGIEIGRYRIDIIFKYLIKNNIIKIENKEYILSNSIQDKELKDEFYKTIGEFKNKLEEIIDSKPTSFYVEKNELFEKMTDLINQLDNFLL